ncbi:hypothetical protein [Metapseudomonas resinovorans]|nr:hypothetical protein [Pseudomonas resinovorans]
MAIIKHLLLPLALICCLLEFEVARAAGEAAAHTSHPHAQGAFPQRAG